jgi:uncharacterized protein YjiS (DUF1127 family)
MDANSAGGLHLFDACASKTIRSIQCEDVEMIMSANLSAPTGAQRLAGQYWRRRLVDALKRQWVAYKDWYDQQQAIAQLDSMSDAQLKDIGLVRSQIEIAVRAGRPEPRWSVMHF